jgi:hypothetical protein
MPIDVVVTDLHMRAVGEGMAASASKAACMPIPAASNALAAALMSFLS